MNIGYYTFGKNSLCYGLSYIMWKNGIKATPVTLKTIKYYDVVLFSVFWWQHVIDFYDLCNKCHIGKKYGEKPFVIVGGFNTYNPVVFKKYAHAVCAGDGEDTVLDAIAKRSNKSIYTGVESNIVYANADISNNKFIYYNESNIARIEIARGCKYKCKFCQLSALKKYREVSIESIEHCLKSTPTKRCVLFAPNKTSHSKTKEIQELLVKYNKTDMCPDVRYNEIDSFYGSNFMQIGIEGISEKLRKSVGKPLSNDGFRDIIKKSYLFCKAKGWKPTMFLGFIVDLPGENDSDWQEFSDTLDSFQRVIPNGEMGLRFIFNQFQPLPFAQFENENINLLRDYAAKIKKVLYDREYSVLVAGRMFNDISRIKSCVASRGDENSDEVFSAIQKCTKDTSLTIFSRVKKCENALKPFGGIEKYIFAPTKKPWKILTLPTSKGI